MLNQDWLLTSNVLHSGPQEMQLSVGFLTANLHSNTRFIHEGLQQGHQYVASLWNKSMNCDVDLACRVGGWQHCTFWQITAAIWHVGEFNDLLDQMTIVLWLFGCLYSLGQFLFHLNDTYIPIHGLLCFTTCFLASNFTGNHFPISAGTIAHD